MRVSSGARSETARPEVELEEWALGNCLFLRRGGCTFPCPFRKEGHQIPVHFVRVGPCYAVRPVLHHH
jgi:hypothetical protein